MHKVIEMLDLENLTKDTAITHPNAPIIGEVEVTKSILGDENFNNLKFLLEDLERFKVDIIKALSYTDNAYYYDNVVGDILQGRVHFYPLSKSFIIAYKVDSPNFSCYHIWLAGGELQELIEFVPNLQHNAKQLKCKYVTLAGRLGWTKALKHQGWKHTLNHLALEV